MGGWRDNFACGCGDESRAKAEAALRELFPKMEPGEENILTGEMRTTRYKEMRRTEDGKWVQNEEEKEYTYAERRQMDLTESAIFAIAELAEERGFWIESITYAFDQWAGMTVTLKCDEERGLEPISVGSQLDFGLMPYALAMIYRDLKKKLDEVSPGRFWDKEDE
jgi:hypothetical protein